MNTVAIIGTGIIGTRLAEYIIQEDISSDLFLFNRSKEKLDGIYQSLSIWSEIRSFKCKILKLYPEDLISNLEKIDYLIISIKEHYDPRTILKNNEIPTILPKSLRYAGLMKDLPQIKAICEKISHFKGKILVITNPVDIITYFVNEWIPEATVFCLGVSLDGARLSTFFNLKNQSLYGKCLLAGEHGNRIIPIEEIWRRYNILNLISEDHDFNEKFERSKKIGIEIVSKLGYTLHDSAFVFSNDLKWLMGLSPHQLFNSFSIPYKDICVGKPIYNTLEVFSDFTSQEVSTFDEINYSMSPIITNIKNYLNL